MGTRGFVVIKYNGVYYIFYNNSSSYLSCLGLSVLKEIKEIIQFDEISYVKSLFSKIKLLGEFNEGDNHFCGIIQSLKHSECFQYITSFEKPDCSLFIEWIYTVDFDNNLFTIQNYDKHYKVSFSDLPEDLNYDALIVVDE